MDVPGMDFPMGPEESDFERSVEDGDALENVVHRAEEDIGVDVESVGEGSMDHAVVHVAEQVVHVVPELSTEAGRGRRLVHSQVRELLQKKAVC
jgi:hypothetical protein